MSTPTIPLPNGHSQSSPPEPYSHMSDPSRSNLSRPSHPYLASLAANDVPLRFREFERVDVYGIKRDLAEALGENGLPYWKALNGYLLGQLGRGEIEGLVRRWLKGSKVHLHNRLLLSLLHNASSPITIHPPSSPLTIRKRKRRTPDDPDFDTDETYVEPRSRITGWVMGMTSKERSRVRRMVVKEAGEEDAEGEEEVPAGAGPSAGLAKKKWTPPITTTLPPVAATTKHLPSATQLSGLLSQMAKTHDLGLSPDALGEIGEFMAVGMDAHLTDILHALVHLTSHDRPISESIRIPHGHPYDDIDIKLEEAGEILKPDLVTLQALFSLNPSLHPSISPALYRLLTSFLSAEAEYNTPVKLERDIKPDVTMMESSSARLEKRGKRLVEEGLVKIDNVKKGEDGEGKRDKKHNLHWKYEDPALILRDVLG